MEMDDANDFLDAENEQNQGLRVRNVRNVPENENDSDDAAEPEERDDNDNDSDSDSDNAAEPEEQVLRTNVGKTFLNTPLSDRPRRHIEVPKGPTKLDAVHITNTPINNAKLQQYTNVRTHQIKILSTVV